MKLNEKSKPFWSIQKEKIKLNYNELLKFMSCNGWGYLQLVDSRTAKKSLFQNDNGVLKLHSSISAKKWLIDAFNELDDDAFITGQFKIKDGDIVKSELLEAILRFASSSLEGILQNVTVYSIQGFPDTKKLNLFKDKEDTAFVRFKNGIVKVTKKDITLLPVNSLSKEGLVWETELLPHEITLEKTPNFGVFEKFVRNAFKREITEGKSSGSDFEKNFKLDEDQFRAWKESFGFLVHNHKKVDSLKCIIYIDSEGTFERPEGGNGKSLILEGVQYYKDMIQMDGKAWRNDDKFTFSSVTPQTKFVLINDLNKEFKFDRLFNVVTDDMQIEGKGTNKLHIPKDRSPKIAVSTNEVISGIGNSYSRRQHIVEFGNFWNRIEKRGEKVSEHLGKMLYQNGFEKKDWNDFYNFGFRCIQEFLNNGLTEADNANYKMKSLQRVVEGSDGDGTLTAWFDKWIRTTRLERSYNTNEGISKDNLYREFVNEFPHLSEDGAKGFSKERFNRALFKFVSLQSGYYYNNHKSQNGDTYSLRRYQVGGRGNQKDHIVITTDFDADWLKNVTTVSTPSILDTLDEDSIIKRDLNSRNSKGYEIRQ